MLKGIAMLAIRAAVERQRDVEMVVWEASRRWYVVEFVRGRVRIACADGATARASDVA